MKAMLFNYSYDKRVNKSKVVLEYSLAITFMHSFSYLHRCLWCFLWCAVLMVNAHVY